MALKNYICQHCNLLITNRRHPSSKGCPSNILHYWISLSEVGDIKYKCKNCGLTILSKETPSEKGCKINSSHDWERIN